MLKHLYINNYALIQELDIDLSNGFSVITGETGAGKSILLGALSLILGQRADSASLQEPSKKCIIEGTFQIEFYNLIDFFNEISIDYSDECILRREILPSGTSRAFINDTPVNLSTLKELSSKLIDIHSQHQTLSLSTAEFQMATIDSFAGNKDFLNSYRLLFFEYKNLQKQLSDLVEKDKQFKKEQDYIQFQLKELEDAGLDTIKQQELENELELLNNAEEIKIALSKAVNLLNDGDINILNQINQLKQTLHTFSTINNEMGELFNRINSSYIDLKDICNDIETLEEKTIHDPEKITNISSSLDSLYRLYKKYGVKEVNELIKLREELSSKLFQINNMEETITATRRRIDVLEQQLKSDAQILSDRRINTFKNFESEWLFLLQQLGMENARIKIEHKLCNEFENNGIDKIQFYFNANKGGELKEMSKSASGGELSRLMLSIKHITSKNSHLPTIIFDEIDTGVSGAIADKMGTIMKQMSSKMQVISITHLPQIAAKGDDHWLVYKEHYNLQTNSHLRKLNMEERVLEIAKMLSNSNPTDGAIKNANDLLSFN